MSKPKKLHMPEPYATIVNDVTAKDRAYFERNPKARFYRRPYVEGEFGPGVFFNLLCVEVHNHRPGVRTRLAIMLPKEYLN